MAKLNMLRFNMVALISDSKSIIDLLQRKGVVEFSHMDSDEGYEQLDTVRSVAAFERQYLCAEQAREVLQAYSPRKSSFLASFAGKKELSVGEYNDYSSKVDLIMERCGRLVQLKAAIDEQKAVIVRFQTLIDGLAPWKELDIPMLYRRTEYTSLLIGTIQRSLTREQILTEFAAECPEVEGIELEIVSTSPEQTCIVALCFRDDTSAVLDGLRGIGFAKPADMTGKLPSEVISDYKLEIGSANLKIDGITKEIKAFSDCYDDIDFVCDYYLIQKEKYETLKCLGLTASTFFARGYVPEKYSQELKQCIEAGYSAYIEYETPDADDEDVPVLLENNSFASGVEGITDMYSVPGRHDLDPNPVMSFFYYALFGLMLSDAGYGLLMMLVTALAKKKLKLSESMNKSMIMFFYCGLSSVIWGVLFGGFFGDMIPIVAREFFGKDIGSIALWFEPVANPMKLLLYSFLFGIIHLFAGLGVRFVKMIKNHDTFGAFCDVVPVVVFVTGFAIMGAGIITNVPPAVASAGKYLLIAGAALVVLTSGRSAKNIFGKLGGGLYGLYNTASGYLGDILSYSRLLALCLVTGVIAGVINMLGTMPGNIVVKALMFVPVFILGHTVNMAINLIGTYVHTNRLQYVEFFSKFYEGGGRSFTPFNVKTKHYIFKEETYNG